MRGWASRCPRGEGVSWDRRLAGGGWDGAVLSAAEFGESEGQVFLCAAAVQARKQKVSVWCQTESAAGFSCRTDKGIYRDGVLHTVPPNSFCWIFFLGTLPLVVNGETPLFWPHWEFTDVALASSEQRISWSNFLEPSYFALISLWNICKFMKICDAMVRLITSE